MNADTQPITVSIDATGKIFLQETEIPIEELVAKLQAISKTGYEERIFIRGDKSTDYGTAMTLALIAAVMVFAAGLNYRYIVGALLAGFPVVYLVLMSAAYRRKRLLAFWDPWSDPLDGGFQIIQSLIAVGAGGISGRGFMAGVQKLFYLPEPHTDFIFAVIGEEFGLIGTTLILACFVLIAWRGMRVAMQAPDRFGSFLAIGLTTMVAAQALVNISVVLGLMPTKGIPLPFVSSGGSSLVISLVGMGILLNVSQHAAPGS